MVLSVNEPFSSVLGMADLLVSFSSTTIEEALQNRIPVLLYGGEGRYQHAAGFDVLKGAAIVPSAVYHVKRPDDLSYAVKGILDMGSDNSGGNDVFAPYIFDEKIRTPLAAILNM